MAAAAAAAGAPPPTHAAVLAMQNAIAQVNHLTEHSHAPHPQNNQPYQIEDFLEEGSPNDPHPHPHQPVISQVNALPNALQTPPAIPPMEELLAQDMDDDVEHVPGPGAGQVEPMEGVDQASGAVSVASANASTGANPVVHENGGAGQNSPESPSVSRLRSPVFLTDDVLATTLAHMPALREVRIDHARHVLNGGILPLAHCRDLATLVLTSSSFISHVAMKTVLSNLTKLRVLRLRDMYHPGDAIISAICNGPIRKTLRLLELHQIAKVTDPGVKQLVCSCENLETVLLTDCPRITCDTASHLSCTPHLKRIVFKPTPEFPLTNRTAVHFSCAASTLQSLELIGCKKLSLDGIMALGNLPGLKRLHLRGLGHVSQDVMRQVGTFPRLDDLLLEGPMHLTDLGVKVLIARRGHRFLHLGILDSTKNLQDEALDCIMTWCVSLRSLEVHGQFKRGAISKLEECMPNTSLTVVSNAEGRQFREGHGGVWDPIVRDVDALDGYAALC